MAKPSSTSITTPNNDRPSTKSEWNYHPHIPIDNNPLFSWPIRWKDTLIYYRDSWLVASEGTIFALLAVLSWQFFSPEIGAAQKLEWSWVGGIWLRNFIVLSHCWRVALLLFSKKKQGTALKYVPSFMSKGNRFLFNNPLDNMFYALVSGVLIWSCYEVLMFPLLMVMFNDHL